MTEVVPVLERPARRFDLLRGPKAGAATFFLATSLINVLTFGFHLIFSRSLGPKDYGALGALLAVIIVLSVPLGAVQLSSARAAAIADHGIGLRTVIRRWVLLGVGVFLVMAALSPLVSYFLKLHAVLPAIFLAGWLGAATSSAAATGILVGQGRLTEVAVALFAGAGIGRLGLGVVFSAAHFGVSGAMAATLAGQLIAFGLLLLPLAPALRSVGPQLTLSMADGVLSISALSGFALFGSIDDILARHLFAGSSGGFYVAAATAGRIALFVPGSIALIAFSSFSKPGSGTSERTAFMRSFGCVAGLGALVAVVMSAAPSMFIRLLFGGSYAPAAQLLPLLAVAGAILGCLNLTTYFHIAHRSWFALLGWVGSLLLTLVVYGAGVGTHALAVTALTVATGAAGLSLVVALRYVAPDSSVAEA